MTFTVPPHKNETVIKEVPVLLADGMRWTAYLGDVQVRGVTREDARLRLAARLNDLIHQLLIISGQRKRVAA